MLSYLLKEKKEKEKRRRRNNQQWGGIVKKERENSVKQKLYLRNKKWYTQVMYYAKQAQVFHNQ